MKITHCDEEGRVLEALASGRWAGPWGEEIRRHVAKCPVCAEVALVAEALRREDTLAQAEARLPSAGFVWWKAQLAARRAAAERAEQPLAVAERVAEAFGALSAIGVARWQWPRILAWVRSAKHWWRIPASTARADWMQGLLQSFGGHSSSFLLLASAGAFLILMVFAAYLVSHEE